MMNTLAPGVWILLKSELCEKMSKQKTSRTLQILQTCYLHGDVIFLQEADSLSNLNPLTLTQTLHSTQFNNSVKSLGKG